MLPLKKSCWFVGREGRSTDARTGSEKCSSLSRMPIKMLLREMTHLFFLFSFFFLSNVGMAACVPPPLESERLHFWLTVCLHESKNRRRGFTPRGDSSKSARFEPSYHWAPGILFDFSLIQQGCHFLHRLVFGVSCSAGGSGANSALLNNK